MDNMNCDFGGYATRNDLLCGDGRTIRKDAFKDSDGQRIPLIWNHDHTNPDAVLGHAVLENRSDGVYAYCTFNDTEQGKNAKALVQHGDVRSLSIWANKLKQIGNDVVHGVIRELSLVLAGANPGAYIDFVMAHGEGDDDTDSLYANYDENALVIYHSDDKKEDKEKETMADEKKPESDNKEKTLGDVFETLTEEQKTAVYAVIGMALEEKDEDDESEKGDDNMKHNVFDKEDVKQGNYISHAEQVDIIKLAKNSNVGTFQTALRMYAEDHELQHDALASGFVQTGTPYNIATLFPDHKEVRPGAPELVTSDQGWISKVLNKVHKSPIARIRTSQVDIRQADTLRAKGYTKGKQKGITGNFNLSRRTTDPQTIFVKNALHRDDILDIEDFDYIQYMYNIDKMMLNEELATAIMISDFREDGDENKIAQDKIRPIWQDDDLYTIHVDLDIAKARQDLNGTGTGVSFGENYIYAEAMINTVLYAREHYKGSGTPDMFITPHMLNVMLLARDMNGRRIYSSVSELASALNVASIVTVEQFEGKTRTDKDGKTKKLLCMIVNLADYHLGATKGGQVTHFTQFDIDFNQEKSLLETRVSGALTKIYSAIAVEEPVGEATETADEVSG